jgi:hypothetical protein
MDAFRDDPNDLAKLQAVLAAATLAHEMPGEVETWHAENVYYDLLQREGPEHQAATATGAADALTWWENFAALGARMQMQVPAITAAEVVVAD